MGKDESSIKRLTRNIVNEKNKFRNKHQIWNGIFEFVLTAIIVLIVTGIVAIPKGTSTLGYGERIIEIFEKYTFIITIIPIAILIFNNIYRNFRDSFSALDNSVLVNIKTEISNLNTDVSNISNDIDVRINKEINALHADVGKITNNLDEKIAVEVKRINSNINEVYDTFDGYMKKSRMVFESGIEDFRDDHLTALQKILDSLEKTETNKVYSIDNSDPIQWWSETMTGYLALLSKWKSLNRNREVHRIFVLSKNELRSPITNKTIVLHSLMGFKTYVFSYDIYNLLFTKFKTSDKLNGDELIINQRECFTWNNPTLNVAKFYFDEDNKWSKIAGYQSFWDITSDRRGRSENMNNKTYKWAKYTKGKIESQKIDIWFEFIATKNIESPNNNWANLANQHYLFVEYLIENSFCVSDEGDVDNISQNFGIEIRTESCSICNEKEVCDYKRDGDEGFSFISSSKIKDILDRYFTKAH